MRQTAKCCLLFLAGFLATAAPAHADAIKIGGAVDASSCVPFGCSPGTTYQQVVAGAFFSNVFDITGLGFFNTIKDSGGDQYIDPAQYEIWLSTTGAAVDGLHTTDFASNRGADATRVFGGPLGGSPAGEIPPGPDAKLSFAWTSAFHFDPRTGNLLIEVRKVGGTFFGDDGTYLDFGQALPGVSFVSDFGAGFNGRSAGLHVEVSGTPGESVTPVPEPATLVLIGGGLAGLWVRRRRPTGT